MPFNSLELAIAVRAGKNAASVLPLAVDDELPGIVVELALAEDICKRTTMDKQEIVLYSLPIIVEGTYFYATPITMNYLETLSKNSNYLPQNLFDGKQMYMYDTKLQKIMNFNIADF